MQGISCTSAVAIPTNVATSVRGLAPCQRHLLGHPTVRPSVRHPCRDLLRPLRRDQLGRDPHLRRRRRPLQLLQLPDLLDPTRVVTGHLEAAHPLDQLRQRVGHWIEHVFDSI